MDLLRSFAVLGAFLGILGGTSEAAAQDSPSHRSLREVRLENTEPNPKNDPEVQKELNDLESLKGTCKYSRSFAPGGKLEGRAWGERTIILLEECKKTCPKGSLVNLLAGSCRIPSGPGNERAYDPRILSCWRYSPKPDPRLRFADVQLPAEGADAFSGESDPLSGRSELLGD